MLKKLVLIHDNLPRVHEEIKRWNLRLETSEKYLATPPTPESSEDLEVIGSSDEDDGNEPDAPSSRSLLDDL